MQDRLEAYMTRSILNFRYPIMYPAHTKFHRHPFGSSSIAFLSSSMSFVTYILITPFYALYSVYR
jgi:hypothetical protein